MKKQYRMGCIALALAAAIGAADAGAFFPYGGFDIGEVLRIGRWKVGDFDTNNDGRINPNEGLEYLVETGPSGFNRAEVQIIEEAFQVWEDVPTSYAAFLKKGEFQDPVVTGDLDVPDFLNLVSLEIAEPLDVDGDGFPDEGIVPDPADIISGALGGGLVGIAFIGFAAEETVVDVGLGEESFIISAGTMYDVDLLIDAAAHRVPANEFSEAVSLKGTMTHLIGYMLGMNDTPLNNVRSAITDPNNPAVTANLEENEIFYMTRPSGTSGLVGVTPTMFSFLFDTRDAFGDRYDGMEDLAPDDISGISWLYPRGDQSNFFTVHSEARSQVRNSVGLPSAPLAGGHIVAWADHDNNASTQRIPMFSTMSGLYDIASDTLDKGKFSLYGMWKQFEVQGGSGVLFNPTYTFSFIPLNNTGFNRQAPPLLAAQDIDSIQGPISASSEQRAADEYAAFTPSEVFHEVENIIDISNKDVGTPLVWNFSQNTLVSQATGRRLSAILSDSRPMFGDPNDVCPLNFIGGGGGGTGGDTATGNGGGGGFGGFKDSGSIGTLAGFNDRIRHFRDNYLLRSAPGMAAVEVYYASGPFMVDVLVNRPLVRKAATAGLTLAAFAFSHIYLSLAALLTAVALPWLLRRRFRAVHLLFIAVALQFVLAGTAEARIQYITQQSYVAGATDIFTGTVESISTRFVRTGHIVTDVVIQVDEVAKGRQNKQARITVVVPGGRRNGLVMNASGMPSFEEGQKVLVYVREVPSIGFVIHGGIRGKVPILTNAKTGEEELKADNFATDLDLKALEKNDGAPSEDGGETEPGAAEADDEGPATVSVSDYLDYIRSLVREERRQ